MRLQDTKFWTNYKLFSPIVAESSMRHTVDGYVYYKLIEKYRFKSFLEIGVYEGQTLGLLAELSDSSAKLDGVDPNPKLELFNTLYDNLNFKIKLHRCKSCDFTFNSSYDFINIDGDKTYDNIKNDIQKSLKCLDKQGVLLINEYKLESVQQAINDTIKDLVPFMITEQTLFFHYPEVDRSNFLDFELSALANNFIMFYNKIYNDHVVLNVKTLPIFTDRIDFFDAALKSYNI
jgi:SAM-dependent methyltransferase